MVAALAAGRSVTASAKVAGVSRRTATRRMADPAFSARVDAARGKLIGKALNRLRGLLGRAVRRLGKLVDDESELGPVRLRAAVAVLQEYRELDRHNGLDARVAALEALLAKGGRA